MLLPHVTTDQRNEMVSATGIGELRAGELWGWVKCKHRPVKFLEFHGLQSFTDEIGPDPDYRVSHGLWVISLDERLFDDEQFKLEQRRKRLLFDLFDADANEYEDYHESMRD